MYKRTVGSMSSFETYRRTMCQTSHNPRFFRRRRTFRVVEKYILLSVRTVVAMSSFTHYTHSDATQDNATP